MQVVGAKKWFIFFRTEAGISVLGALSVFG